MSADPQLNNYRGPDTFDVLASVRSVTESARRHRLVVLFTCLLTLGIVGLYVYMWPPVYSAQTTLMVERDTDPVRDSFYIGWNVFRKDDARTEIQLMASGPVLEEVVKRENLTYDDVYHPFLSHLTYIWEKSRVGRTYRALKRQWLGAEDTAGLTQAEIDRGRTIVDLHAGISVEPVEESNVGRITVKGPSRKVANIANTLVDVYLADRQDRYYQEAGRALSILNEEASKADDELKGIESQRLAFSIQNSLIMDLQKESLELSKLTDLESQIASTRTRIATLEASLKELDRQLSSEPQTKTTSTMYEVNAIREAGKMKRFELETTLIQVRNKYREDSPEVTEIKSALARLDEVIAEASEKVEKATTEGLNSVQQDLLSKRNAAITELEGLRAGLAVMERTADGLNTRMTAVPELQAQLRTLDREYTLSQEKFKEVLAKRAQAAVSLVTARTTMPSMRAVERAVVPIEKEWPKPKYLFPGAMAVGLIVGVIMAVFMSYAGGRILREQIGQGWGAAPLYGTVGVLADRRTLPVVIPAAGTGTPVSGSHE
jgi:uncharacterized protein involved in exopolysaccharide biosynthesis